MSTIDQFESLFRSAIKPSYTPTAVEVEKVMIVTDLDPDQAQTFKEHMYLYLSNLMSAPKFHLLDADQAKSLSHLISIINHEKPQLIVTHRHLFTQDERQHYTLGDHIEVLTQVTETPILLFPKEFISPDSEVKAPNHIMVLTDQSVEHPRLIDYAVSMLEKPGRLALAHIEDETIFDRYMGLIAKIPAIDTETAKNTIKEQMYKDAQDFFSVIDSSLKAHQFEIELTARFKMGHKLQSYLSIISDDGVELVVMQGKDDDQIAMHGLSYPLAVELNHLPLLIV